MADHTWFNRFPVVPVINHTLDRLNRVCALAGKERQAGIQKGKEAIRREECRPAACAARPKKTALKGGQSARSASIGSRFAARHAG
jgi:hypothetical protein